jgi:hypothetical protein
MPSFSSIAIVIILFWASCYTISFGVWTWKKNNKVGAFAIIALTAAAVATSLYTAFLLHG